MARWTAGRAHRTQSYSSYQEGFRYHTQGSVVGTLTTHASGTWPAANRIIYVPAHFEQPLVVTTIWWLNGSAVAGTIDGGIYTESGTKLGAAGSMTQTGTLVFQTVSVSFTVPRGVHYLALVASSASATMIRVASGVAADWLVWGALQEAGTVPLPATATFAANTTQYLPCFGITGRLL
jgi:hypothetical protein